MAKEGIDDLIAAVQAVKVLKEAFANQELSIRAILDEVGKLRERIIAVEAVTVEQKI